MLLMPEVTNESMPEFIELFVRLNYLHNVEFENVDFLYFAGFNIPINGKSILE